MAIPGLGESGAGSGRRDGWRQP